ncbi:MAG: hypothetical protein QNK18_19675 [Gammaproteobacteria bacterium]|nr:hypothetical protein [Gammaproteobacteria bacterium]
MRSTSGSVFGVLLTAMLVTAGQPLPVHADQAGASLTVDLYFLTQSAERIRGRLETLRQAPQPDADAIAQHERYLERLEAQIAARREAVDAARTRPERSSAAHRPVLPPQAAPPRIMVAPEMTETDEVATLDSRLNASMGRFDEMLLQEVETLSEEAAARDSGGSTGGRGSAGAGDAEGEGSEGSDSAATGERGRQEGSTSASSRETASGESRERRTRTQNGVGATVMKDHPSGRGARGDKPQDKGNVPQDIPDGSDDDVVARQIREAAENETDPALREKLWDEYRKYKRGAS